MRVILEVETITTDQESHSMKSWSKATTNNLEGPKYIVASGFKFIRGV